MRLANSKLFGTGLGRDRAIYLGKRLQRTDQHQRTVLLLTCRACAVSKITKTRSGYVVADLGDLPVVGIDGGFHRFSCLIASFSSFLDFTPLVSAL